MEQIPTFGEVLRERRSQLGLTQAELARRASCAPITIRKLEGNALRPSVQLAELLTLALNIPEAEQIGFVRLARQEKKPSPIPKPTPSPGEIGLDDLSGRAVKGFQLGELIGSGGFGVVYRAVQPSVQRDVAVKIILPRFANHPTFIRRFEAEAHLVARLEHPHIVPLYDYWREPNAAYLIMRLLRGGLNTVLAKGPLPLDVVSRIGRQVGQALAAAHAQGVLHQDIKPANILLDNLQNAYLADFGIAKNLAFLEGGSLTEAGTLISSPAYISPEQIRDEPVRPSSDIYCFGLLLYEMLTGQAAFQGPTPVSLLQQHLNQSVPLLRDTAPKLPAGLDELLQQATAKRPQDRFQEMKSFLNALESVLNPVILAQSSDAVWETAVPQLTPQEITALENPYRGLRAFTEADADNFFGRETLVQELLSQMSDGSDLERFVAVVGPSGSGKSSLVKAGLLPVLRRGGLPGSENWFIVDMTPGSRPWAEVAEALRRVAVNPPEAMMAQLQEDNRGLLRVVNRCLPDDGETELLLLIDQFEELFTLVEEEAVREAFLQSLVTAVLDPQTRLRIVITLRADFTDRPLQYVDFGELIQQRLSLVLPLTPDELMQAITRPVENLGLTMSPDLIATMIQDVGNQPGMLPLLQYALTELFEQRQGQQIALETYRKTGGVAGALARRADEIFVSLDDAGQEAARQLFLRLVTLGEGVEDTRRRVLLSELEALPGNVELITDSRLPITEYGRYRLLTFDHDPVTRGPTVEVAHEALLREWPRLRGWLRDGREDVQQQRLLAQAAAQWQHSDQDNSYLLRGSRLTGFEAWAETTTVALTEDERYFLQTSITARDERHAVEEARRQRELETAQQLAREQTERAEEQVRAAHALRQQLRLTTSRELALAANANLEVNPERSLLLGLEALKNAYTAEAEEAVRAALQASRIERTLTQAGEDIWWIDYHPEGNWLAGVGSEGIVLWDTNSGEKLQTIQLDIVKNTISGGLIISADGSVLAITSQNQILVLNTTSWELRHRLEDHTTAVDNITFNPSGTLLASGSTDGELKVWSLVSGEVQFTVTVAEAGRFGGYTDDVRFSPDGSRLAVADDNGFALILDAATGEELARMRHDALWTNNITFNSDGSRLFVAPGPNDVENDLTIWNIAADLSDDPSEPLAEWFGLHDNLITDLQLSPDGRYLATASQDTTVKIWDATSDTAIEIATLNGHLNLVSDISFGPDSAKIATLSNGEVCIWNISEAGAGEILNIADASTPVAFAPDGQSLIAVSPEGIVKIWRLQTGALLAEFNSLISQWNRERGAAVSNDGRYLAIGSSDNIIKIWDLTTQTEVLTWRGHGPGNVGGVFDGILGIDFSPDATRLATGGADGFVKVWDVETGEKIYEWRADPRSTAAIWSVQGQANGVTNVKFSPDGRYLAASTDETGEPENGSALIKIWELAGGNEMTALEEIPRRIWGLSFSPDSRYVAGAGGSGIIRVWEVATGAQVANLQGEATRISHAHFLPDGGRLITGLSGVVIWDLASQEALIRLPQSLAPYAVRADGRYLAATGDRGIHIYTLNFEELMAIARSRVTRSLTAAECRAYLHVDACPEE